MLLFNNKKTEANSKLKLFINYKIVLKTIFIV